MSEERECMECRRLRRALALALAVIARGAGGCVAAVKAILQEAL